MEHSTIVETSINDILKLCKNDSSKTEHSSLDNLTFSDVAKSIDACIKKLQA